MYTKTYILSVSTATWNPHNLEDLLPGIVHVAVNGDRSVFQEAVDDLREAIPDTPRSEIEEDSVIHECENALKEIAPLIVYALGPMLPEIQEYLKSMYVKRVDIVAPNEMHIGVGI